MIKITKIREPRELKKYRTQPGAAYIAMDRSVKEAVLNSLLNEQGHLCAYCMRRIPETRKLPTGIPKITIEHWFPQNPTDGQDLGQDLDYRNMFVVCSGNRGCGTEKDLTCDAKRKNAALKVNPRDANTLATIRYGADGTIKSSDPVIDEDLNKRLNLNCQAISLPETRRRVLNELLFDIKKNHPTGDIRLYCRRKLEQLTEPSDYKKPYVGILIEWLERHV